MLYIIIFTLYFLILLGISIYANKINTNKEDYILGGRRLGFLTTGVSAGAADMSAWLFLGLPGAVYLFGISQAWISIGLVLGSYANWKLVSVKLRDLSFSSHSITIPSVLANHLEGSYKSLVKIIASIAIIIFFTIYVTSGITGGGILLSSLFGISYFTAICISLVFVMIYVLIGGYLAVAWTDLLQGLFMLFIMIIIPVGALIAMNWDFNLIQNRLITYNPHAFNMFYNSSIIGVISLLAWGLGYCGQPHVLVRFMGIKDSHELKVAARINVSWMIVGMLFSVAIGLLSAAYFANTPLSDPEKSIISLGQATSTPIIIALISVAILAAIVSTANAQLLVISSSITEDLSLFTKIDKKYELLISRGAILIIAIVAFLLAMDKDSTILSLVAYAWAGFGAAFGPLMILITRGKKLSTYSGIAGIVIGTIVVLIWNNLHGGIFDIYEIIPGFIISFITILGVNKFYKPTSNNQVN